MSWFVRPEIVRLPLSEGQWITVKRRLSAGEQREYYARMMMQGIEPMRADPLKVGLALVAAYLLDWSLIDDDGEPVTIAQQPIEIVESAINLLEPERFGEIHAAIAEHERTQAAARAEEKKGQGGESKSLAISPLLVGAGGGTNG